ncbi:dihydroneopterin aldolase [Amylibacter sp.]|nr:dihydroneopterin aldolase [Amylibacter sp.]MDB2600046.1 dihydroneopterin aldolase [Amylibacter sp.]
MNGSSTVFDNLEIRAKTAPSDPSLDRISIRDYIKEVEIGAFQVERDLTQRVKFNVVVEVAPSSSSSSDDVDDILSYDMIIEAIDDQLNFERLNLLETLAERVSDQILSHNQAIRVFTRIEKLDRIPGSLGVEIVRDRKNSIEEKAIENLNSEPLVVYISNEIIQSNELNKWLDVIVKNDKPAILCVEALESKDQLSLELNSLHRIELLSIEQSAWRLAGMDSRCVVVDTRTELDWSLKNNELSVWAPSKMILDSVNKPSLNSGPLDLAIWLAGELSVDSIYCIGSGPDHPNIEVIPSPNVFR